MFALLASLIIAGAGLAALAAMGFTVRAQLGTVRQVITDSRLITRDREFLVHITGAVNAPSPFAPSALVRLRRIPHRAIRVPVAAPQRQCEAA